ncbi:MAG TPA: hypothetical protein VMF58_15400 [Rhizomicrobium sp.]|nr:hypothetical protein [Rhizomicrobium sp.]
MNGQVLQLLISVGGIAVMVAICWALFGRALGSLPSADVAAAALARDIPGFQTGVAAVSRDGRAALIEDARDGAIYLAIIRGGDVVTRKLSRGLGLVRSGDRLELRLKDFTLRKADLDLADAPAWETKLKGLAA